MVTPFKPDLSVDYQMAKRLALYLLDEDTDSIVISGTTGESPTLDFEEKLELFNKTYSGCGGRWG